MVKISTLFHRVDGFENTEDADPPRVLPDEDIETRFLNRLLEPLLFDPGDELVQKVLKQM